MKAQTLGLVLGMNVAVACLMMQGCKVTRPEVDNNLPPPVVDPTLTTAEPAPEPTPTAVTTVTTVEPEPAPVVVEPAPSKVATVKPLPPPPAKPAVKPAPAAADGFVYTVKKGDQLFAVSRRYNVRMAAIEKANPGLKPNKIRVGQKIVIPGVAASAAPVVADKAVTAKNDAKATSAAAPATAANTTAPVKTKAAFTPYTGATKDYTVRSGDSLGKIAHENGLTIRALKDLNGLKKDSLRIGQTLKIPAEKVVAAKPAAAKTDKADAKAAPEVAKPFEKKAAAPEVKPAETPAPEVKPAAEAVTPAAATSDAAAAPVVEAAPAAAADAPAPVAPVAADAALTTYTVKENDDMVSVSIAFGISPSKLMDMNDLKITDKLKPGQVLKLPANSKPQAGL